MRILATGRSGQLAAALVEQAANRPSIELVTLGRPAIDLERPEDAEAAIIAARPDFVVNAAAYTAVDRAESEPDRAFAINRDGAAAVARAAARLGVALIHLSTDYVFDGCKDAPYIESDAVAPLNVYGRSKLAGEQAVLATHPCVMILRTSWLLSATRGNFLQTMLRRGTERDTVRVVADQFGNPTSAQDLAAAILSVAPSLTPDTGGIYHVAGSGCASWHALAALIFAESRRNGGPSPTLEAIRSKDYPSAATRPANSSLDSSAFESRFGVAMRPWSEFVPELVRLALAGGAHSTG